jgi:hypothetical protein
MPTLPNLPMFGEFNPNKLRAEFNQFVGIEPAVGACGWLLSFAL